MKELLKKFPTYIYLIGVIFSLIAIFFLAKAIMQIPDGTVTEMPNTQFLTLAGLIFGAVSVLLTFVMRLSDFHLAISSKVDSKKLDDQSNTIEVSVSINQSPSEKDNIIITAKSKSSVKLMVDFIRDPE